MSRNIISVSLPPSLIKQIDELSHAEDRSRSSVMRRALLDYISARTPEEAPESDDLNAIKISNKEYELGQGVTLQELKNKNEMESFHSEKRDKTRSKVR